MTFRRTPTLGLAALTVAADITILVSAVPLARVSLMAAHEDAPTIVILGLLAANLALLALVILAMWTNSALILRVVRKRASGGHTT
jgi:hypothetical protein